MEENLPLEGPSGLGAPLRAGWKMCSYCSLFGVGGGYMCASQQWECSLAMLQGKLVLRPRLFMCLTNMYIALTVCCLKHPFKHFANIS